MSEVVKLFNNIFGSANVFVSRLIIFLATIMFLMIAFIPERINPKKIWKSLLKAYTIGFVKNIFHKLNNPYIKLFSKMPLVLKSLLLGFLGLVVLAISYFESVNRYNSPISLTVIVYALTFAVTTAITLYILLVPIVAILEMVIEYVENIDLRMSAMFGASLLIPFFYLTFLLFKQYSSTFNIFTVIIMIIGICCSYYTAIKGLIICTKIPENLVITDVKYKRYNKYIAIFSLLIILLLNLFCIVVFISKLDANAFLKGQNPVTDPFDLFYYTIVTFATVGYGDILPNTFWGKLSSIIIILSSVLFLIIFVGTVLSAKVDNKKEARVVRRNLVSYGNRTNRKYRKHINLQKRGTYEKTKRTNKRIH